MRALIWAGCVGVILIGGLAPAAAQQRAAAAPQKSAQPDCYDFCRQRLVGDTFKMPQCMYACQQNRATKTNCTPPPGTNHPPECHTGHPY